MQETVTDHMRKIKEVSIMDPIFVILFVAIGGVMIGAGVHFIPVGGGGKLNVISEE